MFGSAIEIAKERRCPRDSELLRRPAHQLVSRSTTKGIMHDESPGDERHRPIDKGKDSSLTYLNSIVPNHGVRIGKDNQLYSFKECFPLYEDIYNNTVLQ